MRLMAKNDQDRTHPLDAERTRLRTFLDALAGLPDDQYFDLKQKATVVRLRLDQAERVLSDRGADHQDTRRAMSEVVRAWDAFRGQINVTAETLAVGLLRSFGPKAPQA